ncbi:MAG: hypothetical protein ACM3ZE_21260, partial [Myxococcales bacterium]
RSRSSQKPTRAKETASPARSERVVSFQRSSAVDALFVAFAKPGGTVLTSDLADGEALAEYAQRHPHRACFS